jgi:hypothetical protein
MSIGRKGVTSDRSRDAMYVVASIAYLGLHHVVVTPPSAPGFDVMDVEAQV